NSTRSVRESLFNAKRESALQWKGYLKRMISSPAVIESILTVLLRSLLQVVPTCGVISFPTV
ncbi:hypothetical protein KIPB_014203, partial [Kipferlia bialata]